MITHGFKVSAHASGPELLAAIDATPKPLRGIFVLDRRMDPMSGPQVHEKLCNRGLEKRNPVIFISAHGDIPAVVTAMTKGALSYVEKPYTDDTLVPLIRQALELEEEWSHKAKRGDFLRSMWDSLASQQRRVARFKERGVPNKVSADKMNIVERTVEEHWVKVRDKLGVDSAAELATTMADMRAFGIDVSTEDD